VGAILSTGAPHLAVLILGKLIYGLGIAFALHGAPAYLAEMGHARIRGLLIGCVQDYIARDAYFASSYVQNISAHYSAIVKWQQREHCLDMFFCQTPSSRPRHH